MTATITFTGLGSGTDWTKIVDQLVQVESYRVNQMNTWKTTWQDKITSIQGLNSRMLSLDQFVQSKNTASEFMATTATSSDTDVLTATSTSTAIPGAHTIVIGSSIQHRLASDGKADQDTTDYASAGNSFKITVGSSDETITFASDSNLDEMVTEINTHSTLVTAEVIDDGSSSNSYRLVLTSETGGAAGKITISDNETNTNFNMAPAERVDSAEGGEGGTGSVTSGGQYLGTTNKTFRFTVSGTGSKIIGTDSFDVTWTDGEGNSGTISVTGASYTDMSVYQGLTISFGAAAETILGGDTFSVDVWHNDLQAGQDEGLAQVEQEVHSGFSDSGTTAVTTAAETFSYTYNGRSTTIDVASGTTLTELKDLINNDPDNPGVKASIINDGMGLSSSYHLVLTGQSTGAAYKITSISHTLNNFGATFTESQSAQNAMLKVDGYPPSSTSEYIQRLTNAVSDLITGVALSLVGPGTATVGISTDTNAIRTSIEYFVSSINFVLDYIKQETKYNPTTKKAGIMIGNYSYQIVRQRVTDIVTSSIPGLEDGVDPYTHLAQIGISTNPETGKWEIDSTTLDNALSTNLEGVKKLFVKDEITGTKDGVLELLTQEMAKLDDSESGPMNVLLDNYDGVISNIDKNIETEQKRVDLVKTRLQNQFALLETLLGQLAGQEKSLQSYIDQLPTIGGTSS
jgi:flagellar hook-associated protein 2